MLMIHKFKILCYEKKKRRKIIDFMFIQILGPGIILRYEAVIVVSTNRYTKTKNKG
jgi:hypothetical protein